MKFSKLVLVGTLFLGSLSSLSFANPEVQGVDNGRSKVYSPDVEQKAQKKVDVAGFVIASRGQLTATNEDGSTRELTRRSKFYANETLKTGPGARAQLRFKDRALMTLRPESQLNIGEYHYGGAKDPENKSFLELVSGGFRTISGAIGKTNKSAYRIQTPAASIGIRGTDYELVISLDGKVFAAVHDGGISIVNDLGELDLGNDSDYLFAEVGAGQNPLGLNEMPEVFQVTDGEKKELTPEQKAKLSQKVQEGKEKAESILAKFDYDSGDEINTGALQESIFDELVRNDASIDTRISPDLLRELKTNGRLAVLASGEEGAVGDFVIGKTIERKGEKYFLGENGQLLKFSATNTPNSQVLDSGLDNVDWGKWNKAQTLQADGTSAEFQKTVYWMDAEVFDAAAISAKTGELDLELLNIITSTSQPDKFAIEPISGGATVNFAGSDSTIEGSILTSLTDEATGIGEVGELTISFDGPLLANGTTNHQFNSGASFTATNQDLIDDLGGNDPISLGSGVNVVGTLVAPAVANGDPGFAGAFSAQLPTDVTLGIPVGVQGIFTMQHGIPLQTRPPFL